MKKFVTLTIFLSALFIFAASVWPGEAANTGKPANGAAIYNQHCVKCHGAGGKGVENFTPDLSKATNQGQWSGIVNNGKGAMPGFKGSLSSPQLSAVLRHVRSFGAKGGKRK